MRFPIAELLALTAAVGVACVWPVLLVPLVTLGLSQFLATKSRPVGLSLGVVALCLYAPFAWLLCIDYGWGSYRLHWLNMWPILPGIAVGMLLHPWEVIEYVVMGITTLVLLVGLTWLGRGSKWRLALAAGIALVIAVPQAFLAYALFRM
jgi:hypothetical protein